MFNSILDDSLTKNISNTHREKEPLIVIEDENENDNENGKKNDNNNDDNDDFEEIKKLKLPPNKSVKSLSIYIALFYNREYLRNKYFPFCCNIMKFLCLHFYK